MTGRFADNPNYREHERLLLELSRLMAEGKGDTDEADAIRDAMDGSWLVLSREEKVRLRRLSAELYSIEEKEVFEPVDSAERTPERVGAAIGVAYEQKDWEAVLALLRKGPSFLSQDRIAYLRAVAYKELGHPDTALLFLEYARQLDPKNARYNWRTQELLLRLGRFDEALARADEQLKSDELDPELLILSA